MEIIEVSDRTPELMEQLLIIWENSVKETHLFLSEAEIADISKYVPQALAGVPHLIVAKDDANEPVAFIWEEFHAKCKSSNSMVSSCVLRG